MQVCNVTLTSVTSGKLPNTSNELCSTTVSNCETSNHVWSFNSTSLNIVEGKDKRCGGESHQTERSWVGDCEWRGCEVASVNTRAEYAVLPYLGLCHSHFRW